GSRPAGVDAQLRVAQLCVRGAGGEPEDGTREQSKQSSAAPRPRSPRRACHDAGVLVDAVAEHDWHPPEKTLMCQMQFVAHSSARHGIRTTTVYVHRARIASA